MHFVSFESRTRSFTKSIFALADSKYAPLRDDSDVEAADSSSSRVPNRLWDTRSPRTNRCVFGNFR